MNTFSRPDLPFPDTPEVLWLGEGDASPSEASNHRDAQDVLPPRRALVVEDELFVALHLESILQDLGLEVCEIIATGHEAVAVAVQTRPDIIFMDVNLRGDIDGVEAARLAREVLDVPIVFVTAYGDEATLNRIAAVAPDAPVLQKPPTTAVLSAAIKKVIRKPMI